LKFGDVYSPPLVKSPPSAPRVQAQNAGVPQPDRRAGQCQQQDENNSPSIHGFRRPLLPFALAATRSGWGDEVRRRRSISPSTASASTDRQGRR
jgi:hypothetical protein